MARNAKNNQVTEQPTSADAIEVEVVTEQPTEQLVDKQLFGGNKFDKVKVLMNGKPRVCSVEQANYFVKKGFNIEKA